MAVAQDVCHFLIIGPSGAGMTTALDNFSDLGFMQVGDVPPSQWQDIFSTLGPKNPRIAFTLQLTPDEADAFESLVEALPRLKEEHPGLNVLVLDAPEDVLIQRYLHTGKPHPFSGPQGLEAGIATQKRLAARARDLKAGFPNGYYSIDTSTHSAEELRAKIAKILGIDVQLSPMTVTITSFGFKYGVPRDAELVFDMRFLKNPYYVDELRPQTGMDQPVRDYLFSEPDTENFVSQWTALVGMLAPLYHRSGKLRLSIAVGCTGGQHRSVCMAQLLADYLREQYPGYNVNIVHREKEHWPVAGSPKEAGKRQYT